MIYEPSARVLHRIGRRAALTPRQIELRDKNRRRMVLTHYGLASRFRFALWFYPTRAIHFTRYLAHADWLRMRATVVRSFGSISDTRGPVQFT